VAAFVPAALFDTPDVTSTDFSIDTNYDGVSLIDLLTGTDDLAVGQSGSLTLTARLDITNGGPAQGNTAYGRSNEITTPVPSDDPNVTPDTAVLRALTAPLVYRIISILFAMAPMASSSSM